MESICENRCLYCVKCFLKIQRQAMPNCSLCCMHFSNSSFILFEKTRLAFLIRFLCDSRKINAFATRRSSHCWKSSLDKSWERNFATRKHTLHGEDSWFTKLLSGFHRIITFDLLIESREYETCSPDQSSRFDRSDRAHPILGEGFMGASRNAASDAAGMNDWLEVGV